MNRKKIAKLISFLLGPSFTLFPVPYVLVSKFTNDALYALKWTLFSYLFIISAAVVVTICVFLGIFTNFDVSKREQRPILFAILGVFMFLYLLSLFIFDAPEILFFGVFSLIVSLLIIVVVNKKIKASIHLAVLTGVVLLFVIAYGGYFNLLFLLVPLLGWARIKAREHTLREVVFGGFLGALLTFVVYFMGKAFI